MREPVLRLTTVWCVAVKHTLMFVSVVRVETDKAKKRADIYRKSAEKRSECAIACAS